MGKMIDALVNELEQEAATTRRVLERVPNDLPWKPNPKSMSLGQLALHVATIPGNVVEFVSQPTSQEPDFVHPSAATTSELVPALDASVAKAEGDPRRQGRCVVGGDLAIDGWGPGIDGDAARRVPARGDAQSLVSPPRPAVGLPARAELTAAVDLRPERRRESVRAPRLSARRLDLHHRRKARPRHQRAFRRRSVLREFRGHLSCWLLRPAPLR